MTAAALPAIRPHVRPPDPGTDHMTNQGLRHDVVIAMTVITCLIVAVCGAVVMTGHDLGALIGVIGAVGVATLLALGAQLAERQKSTDEKVNGRMTQLLENHQATVRMLNETVSELGQLRRSFEESQRSRI